MKRIFNNVEDMQEIVEEYVTTSEILTMTGLALALGFCSRSSIYEYEQDPVYSDTIKRAKMIVENNYELALRTQYSSGSIFALKNMGWTDKQEIVTMETDALDWV